MENEAVEKARAQIVKAAQKMAGQNMLPGSWGNISIKINKNAYAITPSGRGYDNLTPDDITIVDAAGQTLDGALIPSSELPLHLAIYKALPEANAVVHTVRHPIRLFRRVRLRYNSFGHSLFLIREQLLEFLFIFAGIAFECVDTSHDTLHLVTIVYHI